MVRQFAMFSPLSPAVKAGGKEAILPVCSHWPGLQSEHPGVLAAAWPIHVVRGFAHLQTSRTLILALSGSQAR